jgi:hypothetical protein
MFAMTGEVSGVRSSDQTEDADQDQVNGHDIIQEPRKNQNENPGDNGNNRLVGEDHCGLLSIRKAFIAE